MRARNKYASREKSPERYPLPTVMLPDFGIEAWTLGPVEIEVGLNLYREDLCMTNSFVDDFGARSVDEALAKFMRVEPFWTPLCYRFSFGLASVSYRVDVSAPLFRLSKFTADERQEMCIGAPWEMGPDDTLFEIYIGRDYKRRLRVGGTTREQAERNWRLTAKFLRERIRAIQRGVDDAAGSHR